jgi:bla regulator protein blaR1
LTALVQNAYGVRDYQISGGPRWIYSGRYDVVAKAEGSASRDQLLLMLQTLLEDRFKLTFHRETKDQPVYVLLIGKDGPKLRKSADDAKFSHTITGDKWTLSHMGMDGLAVRLGRELGRTVVDMTGLKGGYDFTLEWTRDLASPPNPDNLLVESDGPSLFKAVQEPLGLKLESR